MMKKLLLIRHAKATHESGFIDFERPLTPSGVHQATVMAQRLHAHNIMPQIIVSSPALRTITTANIFSEHLSLPAVQTNDKIYDASELALLHVITQLPDQHDFIAFVGHNPGISQILYYLTGKVKDVATCAVAVIHFDFDSWKAVTMESGDLLYYDEPQFTK